MKKLLIVILTLGISWTSESLGSPEPPDTGPVDSSHLQKPPPLKMGCETSEDCDMNQYCWGRSTFKRCFECLDCTKVQRKPRILYDGSTPCAQHQTDCGECNEGYQELAGICRPGLKSASGPLWPVKSNQQDLVVNTKGKYSNTSEDQSESKLTSFMLQVGAGLLLFLIFMLLIFWGVYSRVYHKRDAGDSLRLQSEEEAGLTSYHDRNDQQSPTAPPALLEEYLRPPPYFPTTEPVQEQPSSTKSYFRRVVNESGQADLPLTVWNSRNSDTMADLVQGQETAPIQEDSEYSQYSSDDDEVDGPPACDTIPSSRHSGLATENDENFVIESDRNMEVPTRSPMNPSFIRASAYRPPVSASRPPPQRSPPPGTVPDIANDPVVGFMRLGVQVEFAVPIADVPVHSPSQPIQAAMDVHSPPPSPGMIDDTHIMDFQFRSNQSFESSDLSIDSGRGTNDREVPSCPESAADDTRTHSEDDDPSMYDTEFAEVPSSPQERSELNDLVILPRHEVRLVPDRVTVSVLRFIDEMEVEE